MSEFDYSTLPPFERLVDTASKLRPHTGRYTEPSMAQTMAADEADRFLRKQHLRAFDAWLRLGLEQQMESLSQYLVSHGKNREQNIYLEPGDQIIVP